ncbi:hypothetical protein ARMGADRAFT_1092666 [Armillaria gallica]|uniref:Uncharacterized protein n=1 Tax=Armillaria gallica TaxID=47427 RepID=A0A2H3CT06_ARMGA|nr:hypothetical protein ARMGADRAFT_1092666 [Armillaria gallica]
MPAIETTNHLNPRTIITVILAAFFSTAALTILFILCIVAYDTARLEEDEGEARAALPFHYVPSHLLTPLPEARTRTMQTAPYMNPTPPPTPTQEDEVLFDNLTVLLTELLLCVYLEHRQLFPRSDMSDMNPDQGWANHTQQNQNQPPSPPAMRAENTTDRNPFRWSTRGTYGLRNSSRSPEGSRRSYNPFGIYEGINSWNPLFSTTSIPTLNYPTPPWNKTPYPHMRQGTHGNFPECVTDRYDQRSAIASPSPQRPGTASASWMDPFLDSGTGQTRIPTPIPPTSPDPLSDEEDFQTPRLSPTQSPTRPTPSQTRTQSDLTMTPSTLEGQTTSGLSSRRSTERSSACTEVPPGSYDEGTSSSDSSGPTLETCESEWTSTLPPRVAIQSWENTPMPAWLHGYMPIAPETSTRPMPDRGFPTHDHEPPMSKQCSRQTFAPWHISTRSELSNRGFNLDEETFGAAIRDDDATLGWNTMGPLPDSPP